MFLLLLYVIFSEVNKEKNIRYDSLEEIKYLNNFTLFKDTILDIKV